MKGAMLAVGLVWTLAWPAVAQTAPEVSAESCTAQAKLLAQPGRAYFEAQCEVLSGTGPCPARADQRALTGSARSQFMGSCLRERATRACSADAEERSVPAREQAEHLRRCIDGLMAIG